MSRILAIDYGTKRTGLAVTDPLRLIAQPLDTVPTADIWDFLTAYFQREDVAVVVVGIPYYPDGNPAQIAHLVVGFTRKLRKTFPGREVVNWDESFSSEEAKAVIRASGAKQRKRRDKSLVDKVAASLILRDYLESEVW